MLTGLTGNATLQVDVIHTQVVLAKAKDDLFPGEPLCSLQRIVHMSFSPNDEVPRAQFLSGPSLQCNAIVYV